MKKLSLAVFALVAMVLINPAFAGRTRVDPDALKKADSFYGRSDGVYQEANSKGLVAVSNGQQGSWLGQGYRETFNYAAGTGMTQMAWGTGLTTIGLTTTVPAIMTFASGVKLMWASVVTETLYPVQISAALGLDISGDLVNLDGLEVFGGVLGASGRPFMVGKDPAFYFCANVNVYDVSSENIVRIGFRAPTTIAGVADPMNAVFANYDTYATIGPDAGVINISTEVAAGGIVTTNTTDTATDGVAKTYCVKVSNAGVVTYTIDGAVPTVTAARTIPAGYSMIPFVQHVVGAGVGPGDLVTLKLWEVGYSD